MLYASTKQVSVYTDTMINFITIIEVFKELLVVTLARMLQATPWSCLSGICTDPVSSAQSRLRYATIFNRHLVSAIYSMTGNQACWSHASMPWPQSISVMREDVQRLLRNSLERSSEIYRNLLHRRSNVLSGIYESNSTNEIQSLSQRRPVFKTFLPYPHWNFGKDRHVTYLSALNSYTYKLHIWEQIRDSSHAFFVRESESTALNNDRQKILVYEGTFLNATAVSSFLGFLVSKFATEIPLVCIDHQSKPRPPFLPHLASTSKRTFDLTENMCCASW
jgi:hypothetical protein